MFALASTASAADYEGAGLQGDGAGVRLQLDRFLSRRERRHRCRANSRTNLRLRGVFSGSDFTQSPIGAIGGVQAGYNWQFGNWVLGLEADIQASGLKDDAACLLTCAARSPDATIRTVAWIGSARRARVLATPTARSSLITRVALPMAASQVGDHRNARRWRRRVPRSMILSTGWTLGSGVEASLGGNWTGKLEYLYRRPRQHDGRPPTHVGGTAHVFNSDSPQPYFPRRCQLSHRWNAGRRILSDLGTGPASMLGAQCRLRLRADESNLSLTSVPPPQRKLPARAARLHWWRADRLQLADVERWVFGLEADFQGSSMQDDNCVLFCQTGIAGRNLRARRPVAALVRHSARPPWRT